MNVMAELQTEVRPLRGWQIMSNVSQPRCGIAHPFLMPNCRRRIRSASWPCLGSASFLLSSVVANPTSATLSIRIDASSVYRLTRHRCLRSVPTPLFVADNGPMPLAATNGACRRKGVSASAAAFASSGAAHSAIPLAVFLFLVTNFSLPMKSDIGTIGSSRCPTRYVFFSRFNLRVTSLLGRADPAADPRRQARPGVGTCVRTCLCVLGRAHMHVQPVLRDFWPYCFG